MSFDEGFVEAVDAADEVEIETRRRSGETVRTIIWAVVDGGRVYVRSVRAGDGAGYRRIRANPAGVLHAGGAAAAVRAVPVDDPAEVERARMLRPDTLPTTLRPEPAWPGRGAPGMLVRLLAGDLSGRDHSVRLHGADATTADGTERGPNIPVEWRLPGSGRSPRRTS
jgi:hypothetical protein